MVRDKTAGEIGLVKSIYSAGPQDLLAVQYKHQEVLIPIIDEIILEVDRNNKLILVQMPEGLLTLYTEES